MSTFDGVIKEYPLISIDSFLEKLNYASTTYFLSHRHSDHMQGLKRASFLSLLESRGFSKIYVSDVTSHLLKNDYAYQHLSDYLEVLPMEQPTIIILYDEKGKMCSSVTVTLLTAGHCPGSAMFLIEGDNGRVLYTGDFRLPVGSAVRLKSLYENERLKPLRSIYIDTTFCNEKCLYIPSREECLEKIVSLVKSWIDRGPNYIIYFLCPYDFGYEFVFVELYQRFNVKTHISEDLLRKYKGIKHLEDAVTSCPSEARIHSCIRDENLVRDSYNGKTFCGCISPNGKKILVRKIKPSAMFFTKKALSIISSYLREIKLHRVYYSTHSSLSEIRDLVHHLKPEQVFPNVIKGQTEEEILDLIYPSTVETDAEIDLQNSSFSPLGKLKSPFKKDYSSNENDSLPFFDECYQIPQGQKSDKSQSKSTDRQNKDRFIDTDYENTEEQETMLKEEIYSQTVKPKTQVTTTRSPLKWENPIISSDEEIFEQETMLKKEISSQTAKPKNQGTTIRSPLKWENPIISSDEEIFVSSPESSLKDSDAVFGTSEEQDFKDSNLEAKIVSSPENSITSPAKSSISVSPMKDLACDRVSLKWDGNNGVMRFDKSAEDIDRELAKLSHNDNGIGKCETNLKHDVPVRGITNSYFKHKENLQISSSSKLSSNCQSSLNGEISCNLIVKNSEGSTFKMVEKEKEKAVNDVKECPVNVKIGESGTPADENKPNFTIKNKESLIYTKYFNSAVNCNTSKFEIRSDCKLDSDNNKSLNNFVSTSEKYHFRAKNKNSKSFRYVKKINSESESEDEYTFKCVVKLPDKKKILNDTKQGLNSGIIKLISLTNDQSNNHHLNLKKEGDDIKDNSGVNENNREKSNLTSSSYNFNSAKHFEDVICHNSSIKSNSVKTVCNREINDCFTPGQTLNSINKIEHESNLVVSNKVQNNSNSSSQSKILCNEKSLDIPELKACSSSILKTDQNGKTHLNYIAPKLNSSNFNKSGVSCKSLIHNSTAASSFSNIHYNTTPLSSGNQNAMNGCKMQASGSSVHNSTSANSCLIEINKASPLLCNQNAIKSIPNKAAAFQPLEKADTELFFSFEKKKTIALETQNVINSGKKQAMHTVSLDNNSTLGNFSIKPDNASLLSFSDQNATESTHNQSISFESSNNSSTTSFPLNQNGINSLPKQNITAANNSSANPSANSFPHAKTPTSPLVSRNPNGLKVSVINYANVNTELIDLSSDHSDDEVSIIDPLIVTKYEIASSHKNSFPSTSSDNRFLSTKNIKPIFGCIVKAPARTLGLSQMVSEKRLADIENLSKIQKRTFQSKNMSKNKLGNNGIIQYNGSHDASDESPEIVLEKNVNLKISDQPHSSQNKSMIDAVWEIKSVGKSTPSPKIAVEEKNCFSDLDDSPSLIAPIVTMSFSDSRISMSSKRIDDSKRRKIESCHEGASKIGVCDKVGELICDNILVDSDNTPDDLVINYNLLSNKDFKGKVINQK